MINFFRAHPSYLISAYSSGILGTDEAGFSHFSFSYPLNETRTQSCQLLVPLGLGPSTWLG